ncbi:class I adenylate-forming enzyme family protein [Cutibacterium modestum]|uniref:class I adenylate-forming enzyme family protein n=1 Tax=Cutibacterium modestum TaxID=2559073 RepID=UPI0020A33A56|nr:AMP-binding protein [Cutibacterium modestum]MCP2377509.1 long-chain-fatty-acid--CoA ligase [Cutibacterium modestum 31N]
MGFDSEPLRSYVEHNFTWVAGLERNVHRFGDSIAMIDPVTDCSWTYRELGADVERFAVVLAEHGVGPGDTFAFELFNTPQFAICYLAAHRLGAIGTVLNCRLAAGELVHALRDARPKVLVYDAEVTSRVLPAIEEVDSEAEVPAPFLIQVAPAGTSPDLPVGAVDFDVAMAEVSGKAPERPSGLSTYDEVIRLYTSGTTGLPKGVPLPSFVEPMSAHDVIMHFPLTPWDRTLNMTPWFHRGGLHSGGLNPTFYVGGSVVPMREFDPETVLNWVGEYNITFLIGAPTVLERLARAQEKNPRDLSNLRGIVTMGAPLDARSAQRYMDVLTPNISNGYGTTETFWNTFLRPFDLPGMAGTAGRASTDDDVRVVRVFDDRVAEPDEMAARDGVEIGEVAMRSPKCGMSYSGENGSKDPKFHSGWFYPGDLATWDEHEFVTIVGRKDEMIISGGENVFPAQVESVPESHPGVAESLVVGLADPEWGQQVAAYVVPEAGTDVTADDLDAYCLASEDLARFKRPRAYCFVDELPMTPTGKKKHVQATGQANQEVQKFVRPCHH